MTNIVKNNGETYEVENATGTKVSVWWGDGPEQVSLERCNRVQIYPDLRFYFSGTGWAQTARHTPEEAQEICAALGLNLELVDPDYDPRKPVSQVVKNDYQRVRFPNLGQSFEGWLKIRNDYNWRNGRGGGEIYISHNFHVRFSSIGEWKKLGEKRVRSLCEALGLKFELENPRKGVEALVGQDGHLTVNQATLLAIAGYGPRAGEWERSKGLVFRLAGYRDYPWERYDWNSYSLKEARQIAHGMISRARRGIKKNFPGLKRHLKFDDYQAVMFWRIAKEGFTLVKVGQTITLKKSGGSRFGSGDAWGTWKEWGDVNKKDISSNNNGFVVTGEVKVTFDQGPAAVFTAAGDGINGGRTFWRRLVVAE